jgi:hypothetical protein
MRVKYLCDCGEEFEEDVWHCPICDHHWPQTRQSCWNCHAYNRKDGGDPDASWFGREWIAKGDRRTR